jgi:rubrerythrin
VMDPRTYSLIADIIRRESRSLLQYVGESYPRITPDQQNTWSQIRKMIGEELQGVADLMRLLQRRHEPPPYVGSYPSSFTSLSFVSLDHLIPLLAAHEREDLERLEREIGVIADPEADELVQTIIETKRRHLEALQSLAAKNPQPAVA